MNRLTSLLLVPLTGLSILVGATTAGAVTYTFSAKLVADKPARYLDNDETGHGLKSVPGPLSSLTVGDVYHGSLTIDPYPVFPTGDEEISKDAFACDIAGIDCGPNGADPIFLTIERQDKNRVALEAYNGSEETEFLFRKNGGRFTFRAILGGSGSVSDRERDYLARFRLSDVALVDQPAPVPVPAALPLLLVGLGTLTLGKRLSKRTEASV